MRWMTKQLAAQSTRGRFERLEGRRLLAADLKALEFLSQQSRAMGPLEIVGGTVSERGAYGWVASLQDSAGHFCGGTLVAQDAVVTAAHCVEGTSSSQFTVVVGREDLDRSDDGQRVNVSQVIVHPNYNANTNDSDIAVLMLSDLVLQEEPIGYLSDEISSLAVPGSLATSLGWGTTREGGNTVTQLREVALPIVSNAVANRPVSYNGELTGAMLAAGRAEGGVDSCQGDSGGPLIVSDSAGNPKLAGVVSFGEGCGRPNKYGIYTRVTSFDDWLDDLIGVQPAGQVDFNQARYVDGNEVQVVVRDSNITADTIDVLVTSDSGDQETLTLQAFSSGRFRSTVPIVESTVEMENGILNVSGSGQIQASYQDVDNGDGQSVRVVASSLVVVDDFGNGPTNAFTIESASIGNEVVSAEIEVTGDSDWFQFEGVAGSGYVVTVSLDDTSLNDSVVTLYADDGETVLGFDDDSGRGLSSELTYFPNETGTIFIEAGGFGANIGTYNLIVDETNFAGDDHSDIVGGSTELEVGQFDSGRIDAPGDTDWFSFDAVAGTVYAISVDLRRLDDSELRLVDSDGRTELAYNDDRSFFTHASRIDYRADESETLSFEVSGYEQSTGSYDVQVTITDDDHGHLVENATELGVISTNPTSRFGEITAQDVDWFQFDAEENQFFEFTTVLDSAEQDSVLRIYDGTGERVLTVNDDFQQSTFASKLVWQAPSNGSFIVEVAGFENLTAEYELEMRRLAQPPVDDAANRAELAEELTISDAHRGNINYTADIDWLRFDTVVGGTYTFETELGSLTDSVLGIYDEDGTTLLAENDDIAYPILSSRIEWEAETAGPKYIAISAFDGFLGTYTLDSTFEPPPFEVGDVDQDGEINASDIDSLFAAIEAGNDDREFDVNGDGTVDALDTEVLLRDVLGTGPADADLNGVVDFSDFLALSRNFSQPGGWADGDYNGNKMVEFQDFLILANNFG